MHGTVQLMDSITVSPSWAAVLLTGGVNLLIALAFFGRLIFASKSDLAKTNARVAEHDQQLAAGRDIFIKLEAALHENTTATTDLRILVAETLGAKSKDRT
jgi:hypothetical protein